MEDKKAEQEVSALLTGINLLGMMIPAALLWISGRFTALVGYLVSVGVMERSSRVVWVLSDGAGLDLGRLLILLGVSLLFVLVAGKIINYSIKNNKS